MVELELGMFGLMVRFRLRPGAEGAFDELVSRTVAQIRETEPGTLVYAVHTVAEAPQERIFYELYRDRAAFQVHEEQAHVRAFLAARSSLLREDPQVDQLELVTGSGIAGAR